MAPAGFVMNALRVCKSSMAPLCLTLASAALWFWSQTLDVEDRDIPMAFPVRHALLDWAWVHESQDQLRSAFKLSRSSWPLPQNFKPDLDFQGILDGGLNISTNGNSTQEQPSLLWIFCSGQYEECACYGKIRWGTSGRWVHVYPTSSTVANRLSCQVGKQPGGPDLVDVSPGDDTKHCECQVTTGSYFFHCINILALPRDQRKRLAVEEGSNCGIFAEDTSIAGRRLWKGVRGICNASLAKAAAGAKALPSKKLIQAVKTYVTLTFASNYKRFYESGWIKRGFVSYFSGPLEGAQSQSMELLIESVHRFSVYPIVVLHAGMATPLHWSPRVFPRLILLSVAELPLFIGHSITLLLAAVVSRVQTGILLNYNALVFPGVDNLFKETEREINAEYPYPIMPVHFMDKKASDGGTFWGHVEASGSSRQSMRWSHFGLFWTSHALPFLGTLLRGLLRDESYDAKAPYEPIKMRQLHDVESALNVALWTVGARKQTFSLFLECFPFYSIFIHFHISQFLLFEVRFGNRASSLSSKASPPVHEKTSNFNWIQWLM